MKTTLWIISGILGLLSLIVILNNYALMIREIALKPGEKRPSLIPIIGGLLGFFSLRITGMAAFPAPGWAGYAWIPPLLDPGCYIVMIVLMPIGMIFKRAARRIP